MRAAAALILVTVAVGVGVGVGVGVTRAAEECARLEAELRARRGHNASLPVLEVRWDNQLRNVSFYWETAPSRAAAALLFVLLRYWVGYRDLHLARAPNDYCHLSDENGVAVGVWTSRRAQCGSLEKWPLLEEGATAVRLQLHVWLANGTSSLCKDGIHAWPFYLDKDRLKNCSFQGNNSDVRAVLYYLCSDCNETVQSFKKRARAVSLLLDVEDEPMDRTQLMELIQANNQSFLFIDYDLWQDYPRVYNVQPPPCLKETRCSDLGVLDNTTGIRFARYKVQYHAPDITNLLKDLKPDYKYLREILKLDASYSTIEETTCSWARNHTKEFEEWAKLSYTTYKILVVSCRLDYEKNDFKVTRDIIYEELDNLTKKYGFYIDLKWIRIDCYNEDQFSDLLVERSELKSWYETLGVVACGEGAMAVASGDRSMHLRGREQLPMVLYDVAPARTQWHAAVWAVAGTVAHMAAAIRRLLHDCGWRRVAILVDQTRLSKDLTEELTSDPRGLVLQPELLSREMANMTQTLSELEARNARIFLVNAGPIEAAMVLTAAFRLNMTPARGYAWIVREWSGRSPEEIAAANEIKDVMKHYTISPWSRSKKDISSNWNDTDYRRKLMRALGDAEETTWTPRVAPLADAILTLGYGFTAFFRNYPQYRYDIHSEEAVRYFAKTLKNTSIKGFSAEELRYDGGVPLVVSNNQTIYVDEWNGDKRTRLTEWRVRDGVALDDSPIRGLYPPRDLPIDGYGSCVVRFGDPFDPVCLDWVWITPLVLLPLLFIVIWALRERHRKRAARRYEELELARHGNNVTKLLSLVVNRDELEIREELGFGKSGRVNLAILRRAGSPRAVAAKALRDGVAPTEESEFLREACTLASLEHDHVVRLVGVCVVGGPTLVLMEHAFFGDLLRYLRARRHLAEGVTGDPDAPDPEAEHVSPEALTRLAREAASALGYLALRGVVHCDVRAANCLVDARRSLKLADFGMARQTQIADAGLAEYACRRRAMFPVLWMAPESLTRGVFSTTSDVWSLGVLVFELVTLGARPYGDWSPLRVLHFVLDGGRPSLPLDASPQTRGLARACWRRAADERPSAAAVVAYLAERPRALSPALHLDPADPTLDRMDTDSGYCETPSPGPDTGVNEPNFDSYALQRRPDILHDINHRTPSQ